MPAPDYTSPAYALAWPRDVLRTELRWLLRQPKVDWDAAELILDEAFVSGELTEELRFLRSRHRTAGEDPATYGLPTPEADMLHQLLRHIDIIPEQRPQSPYWSHRHGGQPEVAPPIDDDQLRDGWLAIVDRFMASGYLAGVAPRACVDDDQPPPPPGEALDAELERRLGQPGLWPLNPRERDQDTFYSLVEAIGDMIARPRQRTYHHHDECGFQYSHFTTNAGQALYRAKVNELFDQASTGLRLADSGEDLNRLVRVAGDDRDQLVSRTLQTPDPADRSAIQHAVALFRGRSATRDQKRSGVVALARILEVRRQGLKADLLGKDEGALFEIANKFDLRHRDGKQYANYGDEFLDWIFWWYLATIELTDQLVARQAASP